MSISMGIASLAKVVATQFIVPYAKAGFGKLKEAVAGKVDSAVDSFANKVTQQVWEKVEPLLKEEAVTTEQLKKRPEANASLIEEILKDKLEKMPQLAAELEKIVTSPAPGGGNAQQIMGKYVVNAPITNSTVTNSQIGIISGGAPRPLRPAKNDTEMADGK